LTNSWGPRKLLAAGAISAAAGQFLFGATSNFALACTGRAIIGGATAVGWLVLLRLAAHWFPQHRFGVLSGLGLFFGNLGALFAQVPLRIGVEYFGWRGTAVASAALILAVGVLAWIIVRDDPTERNLESYAPHVLRRQEKVTPAGIWLSLRTVFRHKNAWLILIAQGGLVGPIMTFTGLWGPPFLKARFGLEPKGAATISSVMLICWAVANPLFGGLSDRMRKRKTAYLAGALACTGGWLIMIYVTSLSLAAFTTVAALTSLATGGAVLGFPYSRESVPAGQMGTVTATTNIGNMLGNVLLQPGIGILLDQHWSGLTANGAKLYTVGAYQIAFALIVSWSLLSCVLAALTTETHCRQQD
ncbi:MAG TPA: MFS transporter, partial [Bryobacteraceae bacterium]|nr:MFS transporter [Bryobacteraceae bacterium]